MEKLKIFECFSGIGAQIEGFERSGVFDCEVVGTSELDKEVIVSYAAMHNGLTKEMIESYDYPSKEEMINDLINARIGYDFQKDTQYDWARLAKRKDKMKGIEKYWLANKLSKNLGDIMAIERLPRNDLLTFSFPCFVAGTLVFTKEGYKPIEQINVDDYVLTHTNSWQKVLTTMTNHADKLVKISTMPSEPILTTENHPFYVRKMSRVWHGDIRRDVRTFDEPQWVKAKDLTKEYYVGTAINQVEELPTWDGYTYTFGPGHRCTHHENIISDKFTNVNFWYIVGRYMGDGWIRPGGGIIICCKYGEENEITEKLDALNYHYCIVNERTVAKIHIPKKELSMYFERFGRGAENKHLTSDILNLPKEMLEAFLQGYIESDGYYNSKENIYRFSSVSKILIYELATCIAKVYNRPFSAYVTKRPKTCVIEGRTVNQKDTYQVTFKQTTDKQDKAFFENGYLWSPIRNVSYEEYDGDVYNLEVENDNSYMVQNVIVHNCQSVSAAGLQAGIIEGETRSGLVYEVIRLLRVAKEHDELPKYLLLENVAALVSKKFIGDFKLINKCIEEIGYNVYWQVLNAKETGLPQNRPRVFGIYIRKDIDNGNFTFPLPFDTGIRLKDVLETDEEVIDKYFLSDAVQSRLQITDPTFEKGIVGTTKPECRTIGERDVVYQDDCVIGTIMATCYKQPPQLLVDSDEAKAYAAALRGRKDENGNYQQNLEVSDREYSNALTSVQKDTLVVQDTNRCIQSGTMMGKYEKMMDISRRVYDEEGIAPTLHTRQGGNQEPKVSRDHMRVIRKLTPKECHRLQGFKDSEYEACKALGMSDTQGYQQAGNSIAVTCIELLAEHLYKAQFDSMFECTDEKYQNFQ